jgi:hypothetical protein
VGPAYLISAAVLLVAGALILLIGGFIGQRLKPRDVELATVRGIAGEARDKAKRMQRQVANARDRVSRVRHDMRTDPHTALQLDDVLEVLEERKG